MDVTSSLYYLYNFRMLYNKRDIILEYIKWFLKFMTNIKAFKQNKTLQISIIFINFIILK